jgi:SagB-type dehydrogenase family enzyme
MRKESSEPQRMTGREFLKDAIRQRVDFSQTGQSQGRRPPPVQKPAAADQPLITLAPPHVWNAKHPLDLSEAIGRRQSHRRFTGIPLTREELAFLLWATQGVREVLSPATVLRTVPSAGCRHAFETYLCVLNVEGLQGGIYRYLPLDHALVLERQPEYLASDLVDGALGQTFCASASVTFVWTALPYRMEWRYGHAAHKVIALDAGHLCQNLYLACEAIQAGTCAIAAYRQARMDALLQVDGEDEFVIYLAPVGKVG